MDREDSGLIDLFAIHERASNAPPAAPSAPPPAVALDIGAMGEMGEADVPFVDPQRKKKVMIGFGAAGGLLVIGLIIASVTGGSTPEPAKAAAAATQEAPPAPAPEPPPPAVTAAPTPPPPPTATTEAPKPKAIAAAPAKAVVGKAPARGVGGVKLQKVQSSGTSAESKPSR